MTSIPVAICRISRNKFNQHYLQNKKPFSGIFIAFLNSTANMKDFEEENEFSSLSMSEIIDSEKGGYLNALLQNTFRQ